jgi:hypothetical protein
VAEGLGVLANRRHRSDTRVEGGKQIAELIMRGRASSKAATRPTKLRFPVPNSAISIQLSTSGAHCEQALQQHLVERIGHLAKLVGILKLLEMLKPFNSLIVSAFGLETGFAHAVLQANRRTHIDPAFSQPVTYRSMQSPWYHQPSALRRSTFACKSSGESRLRYCVACL